ncbi:FtsK/SpoIIIE family DNA translocase [Capnocytophaga felis]|uniref:DNA translocase FtsK n=1 Tax=Capnocytophaga felis TaxID=2267611 RepID=A0A5M4B827_9FLAO|nr:DNA translocase FtsK [Capnocytophaga felis]GET45759.1 DNA translocase FtsK [Capnocytophaga felis]GET48028.1 DNA translocase FtsK [Capnocytophaga felis]
MGQKKQKQTDKKPKNQSDKSKQRKLIFGIVLIVISLFLIITFVSYFFTWQTDQSIWSEIGNRQEKANNLTSKIGAYLGYLFIYKGFGLATLIPISLLFLSGLKIAFNLKIPMLNRWFWGVLWTVFIATFLGFFSGKASILGGVSGFEINHFLQDYLGRFGTILVLLLFLTLYVVFKANLTPEKVSAIFSDILSKFKREKSSYKDAEKSIEKIDNKEDIEINKKDVFIKEKETEKLDVFTHKKEIPFIDNSQNEASQEIEVENDFFITNVKEPDFEVEKPKTEEIDPELLAQKLVENYGEYDPRLDLSDYRFPSIELLIEPKDNGIIINQEELEENKNTIVQTLKDYKIEISQIKATIGPTVTLYEIVPAAGIRISKIKNLEDDIALSLAALGIRIIAPIPGKGTIGIEVPNKKPTTVFMRSMITSPKFQHAEMELPVAFGKTISNETFVADLTKMPHLLMAGATGQGKSVGLNVVLTSLLYKKHPAEVKFVLVDPKKVELTLFNKIERHFLAKLPDSEDAIITDNKKVVNTLNSLCIEMDNRYELLKNAMVRNIKEYNAKFKARQLNPNDGHRFLPYIVLVVDEFADLIMTAGKEVELPIARLAQLARAIGIHLIIATQRPSVNVITGIIKANFPARIAFRVTSKIDSKTILDGSGAEQLIGRGDMLYTQGNEPIRIQCAFVDTPEINHITEYIGNQKAYPDAYLLPEYVGGESEGLDLDFNPEDRDPLFREAAEIVVNAQQGSASLLQRKLKLGYNRAGRLIDQLEHAGVVGPFEGSKARQVLIQDIVSLDRLLEGM